MSEKAQEPLPRPAWLDKHPCEWPPQIRTAYLILARAAERRLGKEVAQRSTQSNEITD